MENNQLSEKVEQSVQGQTADKFYNFIVNPKVEDDAE